jgi:hypothetical protein
MASSYTPTSPAPSMPSTTSTAPDPAGSARADRSLGRRPSVPGGRALVGAALVVAAAVLTFAAYLSATSPPTETYVVAARSLRANDRLAPNDLRVVTGDLPAEVAARAFTTTDALVGAVVLSPLDAYALIPRTAVAPAGSAGADTAAYEVSFTAPAWKLGGDRLAPGELIEIVPTADARDPSRPAASPVRDVRVIHRANQSGALAGGSGGDVIVSVAAEDPARYLAIVAAVQDEFWIVRSTRAAGAPAPAAPLPTTPPTTAATWPSLPAPTTTASGSSGPSGTAGSVPTGTGRRS